MSRKRWFAWHPVETPTVWVWLKPVWRICTMGHFDDPYFTYEERT